MNPFDKPQLHISLEVGAASAAEITQQFAAEGGTFSIPVPGTPLVWTGTWSRLAAGFRLEARVRNTGTAPCQLQHVRIHFTDLPQPAQPDWRVFLDAGECGWCGVKRLSDLSPAPASVLIFGGHLREPQDRDGTFQRSSLQTVLYEAGQRQAWLWGFLRQRHGHNGIDAAPQATAGHRLDRVTAWQMLDVQVEPGAEAPLDVLVWMSAADPLALLERYAADVQAHHGRRFDDPPIVGMMTWYSYRTAIHRDFVLSNSETVAELFASYPQPMRRLMLLDHGWEPDANWGYWDESDPERFPEGMPWLAAEIRRRGLELGLWYSPFCVTDNCPGVENVQPLLAQDADGQPYLTHAAVWGQLPGHSSKPWPVRLFDGSLPAVQAKWAREMHRMQADWHCVYWKLDFFELIASAARQSAYPAAELYAQSYATFREATGQASHLAPCSCHTNIQLGYADSVRIAADIGHAGAWPAEIKSYARGLSTGGALWYKHRRFWINDFDSIQVGSGSGLNEARTRATAVAFGGGHLMVSEDLSGLSPDRLEIIRRLLPAYGQAARPLDLFEHLAPDSGPHIWQLPVDSDWGAGPALALFNLTSDVLRVQVQPEWLGLLPGQAFGAVEWWQQRWLGEFQGAFEVIIPPADVAVVHAQACRPHPWLISASHHFTGGWIVENLRFDAEQQQLHGELVTRPGLALSLIGTLPPGWRVAPHADAHGRGNGSGGWAYEVQTTAQRTPFVIPFARVG